MRKTGGILRNCWAVLALLLYILSWGGEAFAVLTCRCVHAAEATHVCCRGCDEHPDCAYHFSHVEACCCGVDHTQEQALYTSFDTGSERSGKTLPAGASALVPHFASPVPEPFGIGVPIRAVGKFSLLDPGGPRCGLRAPPVCA